MWLHPFSLCFFFEEYATIHHLHPVSPFPRVATTGCCVSPPPETQSNKYLKITAAPHLHQISCYGAPASSEFSIRPIFILITALQDDSAVSLASAKLVQGTGEVAANYAIHDYERNVSVTCNAGQNSLQNRRVFHVASEFRRRIHAM